VNGDCAVGFRDFEDSVGSDGEHRFPPVDLVMIMGAERNQHGEIGLSAVFPRGDMVDLATIEGHIASIDRACCVKRRKRRALRTGGESTRPTDIERNTVSAEHDRENLSSTRELSCRWHRQ
jgi:hypothetical protein